MKISRKKKVQTRLSLSRNKTKKLQEAPLYTYRIYLLILVHDSFTNKGFLLVSSFEINRNVFGKSHITD